MAFATLLFYAATSFFLGLVAITTGGATVLQSIFDSNGFVIGGSHEPWQTILESLAVVFPLVFVVLTVQSQTDDASESISTRARKPSAAA